MPMASLEGAGNIFRTGSGTPAVTTSTSRNFSDSSTSFRQSFCNRNRQKGRCQNLYRYSSGFEFETVASLQFEVHTRGLELLEASNYSKSCESLRNAFRRKSSTRRPRRFAPGCRNIVLKSSLWMEPHGFVDNGFTRTPMENFKRSVSCKVFGPSPSKTSDDSQHEPGLERGREMQRVYAAPANAQTPTEILSEEMKESMRTKEGSSFETNWLPVQKNSNFSSEHIQLTREGILNGAILQLEVGNSANSSSLIHDKDTTGHGPQTDVGISGAQRISTVAHGGTQQNVNSHNGAALLTVESADILQKTGNALQEAEEQLEIESSTYNWDTQVEASPQQAAAADVAELAGEALSSFTGTASRNSQALEGNRLSPMIGSRSGTLLDSQPVLDESETLADSSQQNVGDATEATRQTTGFWHIVKNDREFLAQGFKWAKEVALPSFAQRAEKLVSLRLWEDPTAVPAPRAPWPRPYYPELSGLDLVAADAKTLKCYLDNAKGWFTAWRIPLKPSYEPEMIADYFNRRPHVLLFRIFQVYAAFGSIIFQLEVEKARKSIVGPAKQLEEDAVHARMKGAELLKEALVKLGPAFIKVGQSVSTRPDLVGSDTAKVLAELQDNLPPFPTQQAVAVIEKELGRPVNEVFSYLSEKPVAAASFGQVYKGRTLDGQDVAVKVQRPNLLHSIALDIYILRMGLAVLRKVAKRRSDLKLYADELGQGLFGELDYTLEAANAVEFQAAHSKLQFLVVPNIITNLSTKRVLTMEWIVGDRPKELLLIASGLNSDGHVYTKEQRFQAKQRLFSLVNKGVEASLVQLLDTGVVHADPHPGNLLYTPSGQMAFLDFGLLCRMEKQHQLAMFASVAHIVNADWKNFVDDLAEMEVLRPDIDRFVIRMEIEDALADSVPKEGIPDIKFSKVLVKVLKIALKHQFKMPPYFILVLRSIASLEGLALAVDPDFKVFASSYPFVVQRLLTDKSAHTRKVLLSLVLDEKKEFRWDRLASFATLARQHTMKRIALETGIELQDLPVSKYEAEDTNPELIAQLVNLLVSKDGVILRRVILEADTSALIRTFTSNKAAVLRRRAASVIANVFYQWGKDFLKEHMNLTLQDSVQPTQSLALPSNGLSELDSTNLLAGKSLTDEMKSLINCSNTVDSSLLRNKQLQFLLRTVVARLRRMPLLMLKAGWTCLTMFCYAFSLASHRLILAVSCKYLEPNLESIPRTGSQLSPA